MDKHSKYSTSVMFTANGSYRTPNMNADDRGGLRVWHVLVVLTVITLIALAAAAVGII